MQPNLEGQPSSASGDDAASAGALLAQARRRAGVTQAQLARRLGISQAAVAQLEQPQSNPRIATLDRALRATGARLALAAPPFAAGIDESLIRQQLELTPSQRLHALEEIYEQARALSRAGARRGGR